jgi:hypothetical protein
MSRRGSQARGGYGGTGRRAGSLRWLQGMGCGLLLAVSPATLLLLGGLMAPLAPALLSDGASGRPVARSVALFGAALSIGPVFRLWRAGAGMAEALVLLGDVGVLGAAWASCAVGWLLAELVPVLIRVALDQHDHAQETALRAARRRYEEQWGVQPQG